MTNPPVFQPRPRRPRPAAATLPAVDTRTLLLGVLAGLLLPVAVMVAWMLGVHQLGFGLAPVLSGVVLFGLVGLAGLWFVLVRRLGWGLPELGLTRARRSLWHLLWEVPLLIAGSGAAAAGLSTLLGLAKDPSGGSGTDLSMGGIPAALLALTTVLLVPVVEELVFRRLLLGWLAARMAMPLAVVLTGVVFALCHVSPTIIAYVLPLGLGLTALRVWHDTLWASILPHVANNALVAGIGLAAIS